MEAFTDEVIKENKDMNRITEKLNTINKKH